MPTEGKSDMERIGLFSEMEYITIGDKYVSPFNRPFNEAASKNRQMLPGGEKEKSALQAGYFDPVYGRIFEGESYSNPVQLRRRYRIAESKKNLSKPFLPSNGEKMPCGIGTYYGTIGGPCPFFSVQKKDKTAYVPPGKNLYTNPGKKGTGYGYPNLTIGKPYSHAVELYDMGRLTFKKMSEEHHRLLKGGPFKLNLYPREYFDLNPYHDEGPMPPPKKPPTQVPIHVAFKPSSPGKKPGGMKAGTFDPFPTYSSDPYIVKMLKPITTNKQGRIYNSSSTTRSRPVRSIMAANVEKSLNVTNYKDPQLMSY
ncbi:cilia-and flagella-associated protein 96 [Heteronotia binoei]|uniref:cilia-and flagella-associated protein 96 n=1 Tax=Heteronotia binoei TaxID=13085 RepID=UPI002931D6D0|nr:cilia-and flagella-associated protein 96 [Heteronotia binoei]XP_060102433.1 cilia-and flagella-associated protein 96 [Heteronotia binoei]